MIKKPKVFSSRNWKDWLKSTNFYQNNEVIIREFNYSKDSFLLGILLSIFSSLMEGTSIALLMTFLRNLSGENSGTLSNIDFIDEMILGVSDPIQLRLLKISFFLLISTLLRSTFMYLGNRNLIQSQITLLERIRHRITDQLTSLSYSFFIKSRSGDLVSVITTEVDTLRGGTQALAQLINKGVYLPLYLIALVIISVQLALIALLFLIVVPVLLVYVRKKVRSASLRLAVANKALSSIAFEFITGIQTILSFSSQNYEKKRFHTAINKISESLDAENAWAALVEPVSECLGFLSIIALIYLGNTFYKISFANILGFVYILLRLIQASRQMNASVVLINSFHGSINSIKSFLDVSDKPIIVDGNLEFAGFQDKIEFQNVYFSYNRDREIIHDISACIPKGKVIAFVGSSGSGKSTLVSLLLRLYDPTSGKILIDSVDLREFDIASVHRKMAVVSQDTFLFNATVKDNIIYGLENVSQQDLENAAKTAYALDFIQKLPNGFDTILGDRGIRLSGGQRQRIAIARAIIRNPEILILDEATSALDNESEKIVQEAINNLIKGKTVIVIAHRLSTIKNADKVIVIDAGRIIEQGTYDELLQTQGYLWKLDYMAS